jgi:hypothetical protein
MFFTQVNTLIKNTVVFTLLVLPNYLDLVPSNVNTKYGKVIVRLCANCSALKEHLNDLAFLERSSMTPKSTKINQIRCFSETATTMEL